MKSYFKNISPIGKILIFITLICLSTIATSSIWLLMNDKTSVLALKILQILNTVGVFIIPCLAYNYLCEEHPISAAQLKRPIKIKPIVITITIGLIALPFINLVSYANQQIVFPEALKQIEEWCINSEMAAKAITEQFLIADNFRTLLFNIFVIAILPAISEELFFRCMIQNALSKYTNTHTAIWISAFIFSAIHLQFYGFIPRMLMGGIFGYMLVWSGSLWLPIIAHFTNNALAVISYYIIQHNNTIDIEKFESFGTNETVYVGLISGAISIYGIYLLRRSLTIRSASSRKSIGN